MSDSKEGLFSFYLEHYRQISEHLRSSDRNRNTLFGFYIVLTSGILSYVYRVTDADTNIFSDKARVSILILLILFGIGMAFYTAFARAWHCEYNRVAKAIHRYFLNDEPTLRKAANKITEDERNKKSYPYFNILGTEFIVMMLVLLSTSVVVYLFMCEIIPMDSLSWLAWLVPILVPFHGIILYWCYLHHREKEFPDKSWCIMDKVNDKVTKEGQSNEKS